MIPTPAHATRLIIAMLIATLLLAAGCEMFPTAQRPNRRVESQVMLAQAERYKDQGLLEAALAAFQEVLENNPKAVGGHIGVGDIYEIKGDYESAARSYIVAKQLDPGSYKATYKLGLMYHLMNRVHEAITEYLAALTIQPESFEANLNLATAYLQVNEAQLGLPYAERAVRIDPASQAAHVNLGSIYAAMEQYELAIDEFRAAAEFGQLQPEIALNLADALLKTGKYERALNTLQTLAPSYSNAAVHERTGYAYFKLGDFRKSLDEYEIAMRIDPRDTASLNGVGVNLMTMYLQGKRADTSLRDRAIESWQKSVQIDPTQQRIIDLIARYRKL